mgnify:CR=1 FL=1
MHSADQLALIQGSLTIDPLSLNLDVLEVLAFATTTAGWLVARKISLSSQRRDGQSINLVAERLEYDAGTLFHVGLVAAGITLAILTGTLIESGSFFASRAVSHLFAAVSVANSPLLTEEQSSQRFRILSR